MALKRAFLSPVGAGAATGGTDEGGGIGAEGGGGANGADGAGRGRAGLLGRGMGAEVLAAAD